MVAQGLGQPVDPVALGDAVQIERDGRGACAPDGRRRSPAPHAPGGAARPSRRGCARARRPPARSPRPSPHRPCRCRRPRPRRARSRARGAGPSIRRSGTATHSPTGAALSRIRSLLGLPGGHLRVHLVDGRLKRRADRRRVEARLREEQRRPARAHGRAVQGVARPLSRHLRHTAPPPSEPRA